MPSKKNISKTKEESSKEESSEEEQEMEWRDLTRPEKKMLGSWRFVSRSSQELLSRSLLFQRLTMAFLVVAASSAFFTGINMAIADFAEEN